MLLVHTHSVTFPKLSDIWGMCLSTVLSMRYLLMTVHSDSGCPSLTISGKDLSAKEPNPTRQALLAYPLQVQYASQTSLVSNVQADLLTLLGFAKHERMAPSPKMIPQLRLPLPVPDLCVREQPPPRRPMNLRRRGPAPAALPLQLCAGWFAQAACSKTYSAVQQGIALS